MKCPSAKDWDLLAMNLLNDEQADEMLAHARICHACRHQYQSARRDDTERVRMYEAFDRNHDELRDQLMAALPDEAPHPSRDGWVARGRRRLGGIAMSMTNSAGRKAAAILVPAAGVLLAVSIFVYPGQQSALAAALERIHKAQTIVCRISMPEGIEVQGMHLEADGELYMSDEYGSSSVMSMNGMEIVRHYAPVQGPMIMVQPVSQTWMEVDLADIGSLDMKEQTPGEFLRRLSELTDESAVELTGQIIDGHKTVGYRFGGEKLGFPPPRSDVEPQAYGELWVDVDNNLPVRFLISIPMPGQDQPLVMTYDEFEWDTPLDAAVFEPDIPDNFVKVDLKLTRPTEEALMNSLERIRDLSDGRYPTNFDSVSVLSELGTLIGSAGMEKLDELGKEGIMQLGLEVAGGAMYYMELVRDGHEPEYFGDEVTADDAEKVLMRWNLDNGEIRVIYGDLRIETLKAID